MKFVNQTCPYSPSIQIIAANPLGSCTISRHCSTWGITAMADFSYFSKRSVNKQQPMHINTTQKIMHCTLMHFELCALNIWIRNKLFWRYYSFNFVSPIKRHCISKKILGMTIQQMPRTAKITTMIIIITAKRQKVTAFTFDDNQSLWWNVINFPREER